MSKVETSAVNKLVDCINESKYLEARIETNDKTPSFDGFVEVKDKIGKKKVGDMHLAKVQVKGRSKENIKEETISFQIEVADLKNYLNDGGVMYFVVYLKEHDFQIYYVSLLPYDINEILNKWQKKETKTTPVQLNKFPQGSTDKITDIFQNFIIHRQNQFNLGENFNMESVKNFPFDKLVMPIKLADGNNFDYMLNNPLFLYGNIESLNSYTVIDKVNLEKITLDSTRSLVINGIKYSYPYTEVHTKEGILYRLFEGLEINAPKKKARYREAGTLQNRIKMLEFLTDLNGTSFHFGDISKIKERLNELKELDEILSLLDVQTSLNMDNLDESSLNNIELLFYIKDNNMIIPFKDVKIKSGTHSIVIGNLHILLWIIKETGDYYRVSGFFKKLDKRTYKIKANIHGEAQSGESSMFTILKVENLLTISNINYNIIKEDIFTIPYSEFHGEMVTIFLLHLILAYDINKKKVLIETAFEISEWLMNQEKDNIVYEINYYQTAKRIRDLSPEEKVFLLNAEKKNNQDNVISLAINILLDNKSNIDFYYMKLSGEDKEGFWNFPISNISGLEKTNDTKKI